MVLNGFLCASAPGHHGLTSLSAIVFATTCYNHFARWHRTGVWDRLLEADGATIIVVALCHDVSRQQIYMWRSELKRKASLSLAGVFVSSR